MVHGIPMEIASLLQFRKELVLRVVYKCKLHKMPVCSEAQLLGIYLPAIDLPSLLSDGGFSL